MPEYEDAGCSNPCGQEPMGCPTCPELGNRGRPHDKAYYMDWMAELEAKGYSPEEIDEIMSREDG